MYLKSITLFCLFVAQILVTQRSYALSFKDALQSSLAKRSSHLVKKLDVVSKEKSHSAAVSNILPTVSLVNTNFVRDPIDGTTIGSLTEEADSNTYLSLSQPLFQGGAEYSALSIASSDVTIAEKNVNQSALDLQAELADHYFNTLALKKEAEILREQYKVLSTQIIELKERARIGKSKRSEVIKARSELARVDAEASRKENEYSSSLNHLKWFVGTDIKTQLVDGISLDSLFVKKEWKKKSSEVPGIEALRTGIENADRKIDVANSGYLPSLDLSGNYYIERKGTLAESDWDVTLTATWELFSGGETRSNSSLQKVEKKKLELEFEDYKKRRASDFDTLSDKFHSSVGTIEKLARALELARISHKEIRKEYKQGLVNNLEVLRSLDDLLSVEAAYAREGFQAKSLWVKLKSMAGEQL